MANDNEVAKLVLVTDWKAMPEGDSVQLDLTEDAWEYGAPPPHGLYDVKLFPAKECVKVGLTNPKDPKSTYYLINYEGTIKSDNEDYNGITVFGSVSTRIFRGKGISTAAGLLVKMGFKVPNPINDKKLAMLTEAALKQEKILKSELDWRGSYSYTDKNGNTVWENCFNHYEEFPVDPETKLHRHMVSVASKGGGMAEVRAQLRVVRFFGGGDKLPTFAQGTKLVSAPQVVQPIVQPQVVQPTNVSPMPPIVSPTQSGGGGIDDELAMLLQQ